MGDERYQHRFAWRMAEADEQAGGDGYGRAEAGRAFEKRSEAEGDEDDLDVAVAGGVLLHPAAEEVEVAGVLGEVVEPEGGEDDP